jgi:hypothetical protein
LNLIGWPSIVVLEPVYSLYVLAQAKRRAFRPIQTRDCEVTFLCYEDTMSERAISIVARKAAAAAILNDDDLEGGLMEFDAGMSLLQELARMVTAGESDEQHADVRAMLTAGAAALKADLESGTAGLVGAIETLDLPPMTLDLPVPAPSPADCPLCHAIGAGVGSNGQAVGSLGCARVLAQFLVEASLYFRAPLLHRPWATVSTPMRPDR